MLPNINISKFFLLKCTALQYICRLPVQTPLGGWADFETQPRYETHSDI